jgi:choline-glycine betaine transporter
MKNPHVIWASVAIIAMLLAGVVILVINGKDVEAIKDLAVFIALPILAAFGVGVYQKVDQASEKTDAKLDQVKDATNGSNDKLLNMVKDLHETITSLALRVPPPSDVPALPPGPDPDDHAQAVLLQSPR